MSAAIYSLGAADHFPENVARTVYRTAFGVRLGQMSEGALLGGAFLGGWLTHVTRLELARRAALEEP